MGSHIDRQFLGERRVCLLLIPKFTAGWKPLLRLMLANGLVLKFRKKIFILHTVKSQETKRDLDSP